MARGNISFRMDSDPSRVVAANARVNRSQKEVNTELRNTIKVSQGMANRIVRDTESSEERFRRLRKQIGDAFAQGKISVQTYGRAQRKLADDFKALDGPFKKFKQDQEESFGPGAQEEIESTGDKIAALGPRLLAILGPAALARQGIQEIEQAVENARQSAEQRRAGVGALRQLASSQEEFVELNNIAKLFRLSGAVGSVGEGADVTFQLASAGLLDEDAQRLFLQLGATNTVPDLGSFARAIATQLAAFGRGETGGATQIASKAFAASGFSPASVEQLLEAAALPGGVARFQGISDEEVLAAVAVLATASGSASQGATALRALLFSTGEQEEFTGLNLRERIEAIRSQGLDTPGLKTLLGRKEAIRGFTDLENQLEQFDRVLAAVERANVDTSAIDRKVGFFDPITFATSLSEQIKAQNELRNEAVGARRSITEALEDRLASQQEGFGLLGAGAVGANFLFRNIGGAIAGQRGREVGAGVAFEEESRVIEFLRQQNSSLDKQNALLEKKLGQQITEQEKTNTKLDENAGVPVTNE